MIYEMASSHNLVGAHSRAVNVYLASAEGVIGERALDREKADATGVGPREMMAPELPPFLTVTEAATMSAPPRAPLSKAGETGARYCTTVNARSFPSPPV